MVIDAQHHMASCDMQRMFCSTEVRISTTCVGEHAQLGQLMAKVTGNADVEMGVILKWNKKTERR